MEVIGVRFPPGRRFATCDPCGHALSAGDCCIVESERGAEFAVVVQASIEKTQIPGPGKGLPRVVRIATREDEEAYAHKVSIEADGRICCLARIAERKLPMKLGSVERQLDGRKMTFYFTAEGRVDFRDLVRDLTSKFHTRVELRQVGARDDAGMQGGCGPCGRALCCSEWLKGFDPISIKMAKAQGLSLSSTKISGICGRLMCCLKYEYDPQAASKRKASAKAAAASRGERPADP